MGYGHYVDLLIMGNSSIPSEDLLGCLWFGNDRHPQGFRYDHGIEHSMRVNTCWVGVVGAVGDSITEQPF